jgi:hypothetical protein
MMAGKPENEQLLRLRLRQMEYGQYPFDFNSSGELVRRLLADILSATEAARKFRSKLEFCTQENAILKEQVSFFILNF